jgi:hypothetical protein
MRSTTAIALAVSLAALSGVSLVANAACSRADEPAPSAPSPDLASIISSTPRFDPAAASPAAPEHRGLEAASPDDDVARPPDIYEPQTFCCQAVGKGAEKKGEGWNCTTISPDLVNLCDKVLHCTGSYIKDGDKIECL